MDKVNALIKDMEMKMAQEKIDCPCNLDELKVGVDLGTSNIVIIVLDKDNNPVTGAIESANVVKDGIVVDFIGAINILKRLKQQVEAKLGIELYEAATAIPPGIMSGNIKVISNVVEGAGFKVTKVVDEPEAAASVLNIQEGAVVDIGGGTTGISVMNNGKVAYSVDEATGGTHLTLVVAGNMNLPFTEAEGFKKSKENEKLILPIVRPVIEKMAHITMSNIPKEIKELYLVGGTSCLTGIEQVFEKYTSLRTIKPENPLLVTPIGIAMYAG
ncbi:ethanolamine utilization protein EutJ [Bacillus marasmi]|uniref:ethanolamine utilization protein EutJ n=1 Tax=Bacillus marasmi TaxID=1926279 RepID=UPI0011CA8437|nr:ethanolamine utilization protein EutJ [Bacillus marasmi]